ncbi:hypothetical protein [Sutcliffiella horikoshii]|uniref:hypothetical protein n=1 Tax=Sutcliffiella horikoshii TaxID=79883 RepID=UPI001F1F4A84|nr:hypothetical protein [Sutcliffiella horikoshii]MCG1022179.1 hypothetical protein [Sutcliffiella horikoshii]
MGDYLFAGLALILLTALFFLFPMKFSKIGKWVIPVIAFLVSVLGIYIFELLTLWHSILSMILLLLLTAILLQRLPLFITSAETIQSKKTMEQDNRINQSAHSATASKSTSSFEELSDELIEKR